MMGCVTELPFNEHRYIILHRIIWKLFFRTIIR